MLAAFSVFGLHRRAACGNPAPSPIAQVSILSALRLLWIWLLMSKTNNVDEPKPVKPPLTASPTIFDEGQRISSMQVRSLVEASKGVQP